MGDFIDKFSNIPWSQKIFLLLLMLAALFIVFYMFFFSTMEDEIFSLEETKTTLISENSRIQSLQERERELQIELARVQSEHDSQQQIAAYIPEGDPEVPVLYERLHHTADQIRADVRGDRLEIVQVVRQPSIRGTDYSRVPIELRMTGTYRQIQDYCWALAEMQQRLIHVRSVSMRSQVDRTGGFTAGPPLLDVTLGLEAYYKP